MKDHSPKLLPRRNFLKLTAAAAAGSQFLGLVTNRAQAGQLPSRMNLLLILTDQERAPAWFPEGWEEANLPVMSRLKSHGLTFSQAFTCTAMCSPARSTLFTGLYPAQHRSPDTLTEDFQQSPVEPQLDATLPNLATCLKEAGYDVVYKGKWHMSKHAVGADVKPIEDDIARYGFDGWDAPDAGGNTAQENFGGGTAAHDTRFVNDAVAFLRDRRDHPTSKPFCLILSLVNPHDVVSYPQTYQAGGYNDPSWVAPTDPPIALPPTIGENLQVNKKPSAHRQLLTALATGLGPLPTAAVQGQYLNFYANLMKKVDAQIGQLLAVFDTGDETTPGARLLNQTLIIRTVDHGENGLCHGGLRQKMFVCYEEAIHVPLVWSNPQMYPSPQNTSALVSHVDLLPTLCALTGVPNWQAKGFQGVDYSSLVLDPSAPAVQDYVLFTFDDIYAGADAAVATNGMVSPPNRLQMIRTSDFKYARYYDSAGSVAEQEEFYDLRSSGGDYDSTYGSPLEMNNLSSWAVNNFPNPPSLTAVQRVARTKLVNDLAAAATTRLQPRPAPPRVAPEDLKLSVVNSDAQGGHVKVQISFLSRTNETYQVQKSTDLLGWTDLDAPITGNNGPVLRSYDLEGDKAFYRLKWAAAV